MSHPPDPRQAAFAGRRSDGTPVQRPLSPHLQAYDMLQMTSAVSIMCRITGVAWSVGVLLLVWWLAALATGPGAFAQVQWFMSSFIGLLVLFGLVGYVMRKLDFPTAPLVLGLVLGDSMEKSLRQSLMMSQGDLSILLRPIPAALLGIAAFLLVVPLIKKFNATRVQMIDSEA
jgi:TctA family transporter